MNGPESNNPFKPKQALAATPALYHELVGDGMENLAKVTLSQMAAIPTNAVVHDNGCGTGAATAAVMADLENSTVPISVRATDINEDAIKMYRQNASEKEWPAEAKRMDSTKLDFPDGTFTHSISNALLFVLPNDGIDAVKETYRTLRPGGIATFNCWAYGPNIQPLNAASKATRPADTPGLRHGLDKWENIEHLRSVLETGGFAKDKIEVAKKDVYVTTAELTHYSSMLWSFIGGTSTAGWIQSDEDNWDRAIEVVKEELKKTDGYQALDGGRAKLKFVANIAIATK